MTPLELSVGMQPAHAIPPALSAEVFVVALDEPDRFLVYAPLRRAAFIGTHTVVNFIANLNVGFFEQTADPDGSLTEFLRRLEIVDAGPEILPITHFLAAIPSPPL